jgi:peptide/nickel transport system permease protein
LREDYLRTARSKGLRPWPALLRHGLRNAAVPVVTVLGLQLAALLIGAVVIERVFVIPGLGQPAARRGRPSATCSSSRTS